MDNCCLRGSRSSTTVWAEAEDEQDQWVYFSDPYLQQKESLLSDDNVEKIENSSVSVNGNNNGKNKEVKIMMSKKKLEELLGKVEDLRNMPIDQLLNRLIDSGDQFELYDHDHLQQPWKPSLVSIPEDN